jgi:hypothetical protein
MEFFFPRYLLSKQSVDDRALNKDVLSALKANLPDEPLSVTEVGGGIGTMVARLLKWDVISQADYTLVDGMPENIEFAKEWLPKWGKENGLKVENTSDGLRMVSDNKDLRLKLVRADVFDFIARDPSPADLLIAHALLDLLPMPNSLAKLLTLTKGLAWLTINFDGVTAFEPLIDKKLDSQIERLYHDTMDTRPGGGDSLMGRHLFGYLKQVGAEIETAGSSDWVVHPVRGRYPYDEAYFLQTILHFFEESLGNHPAINKVAFAAWLQERRDQVAHGELVYIAHQMDFLARK